MPNHTDMSLFIQKHAVQINARFVLGVTWNAPDSRDRIRDYICSNGVENPHLAKYVARLWTWSVYKTAQHEHVYIDAG
jgi:hypothetical protein